MLIVYNGQETNAAEGTSILQFINANGLNPKTIVVELNYEIVKEPQWDSVILKANDTLEVLNFVGGG